MKKLAFLTLALCASSSFTAYAAYEYGDPSAAEQAHLEAINRARANPQAEADRFGIDVQEGTKLNAITTTPKPPVTLNNKLSKGARLHSQDMIDRDFFDHENPDGETPFQRMTAQGYNYALAGENIAFTATTRNRTEEVASLQLHDLLFEDEDYPNRGHRVNMLVDNYKEVGIGLVTGKLVKSGVTYNSFYVTTDFASNQEDLRNFIVGVAYDDTNNDGMYTAGEGLSGVTVSLTETGDSITTASAGGYAIPVENGEYTIKFTLPSGADVFKTVTVKGANMKADVLGSEFSGTTTPPDTGTTTPAESSFDLSTATLSIDVVDAGFAGKYTVKLRATSTKLSDFEIFALSETTKATTENSATFNVTTGELVIPEISVTISGKTTVYSAKLIVDTANPQNFKILSLIEKQ